MDRLVLVRYGEIALKSKPVRREFEEELIRNMKLATEGIPSSFRSERGRIFIETPNPEHVAERVSKIPGVVSSSPVWGVDASMEDISEKARELAGEHFSPQGTFAVRAREAGESDLGSQRLEDEIGTDLLENFPALSVDLDRPDHEIHVEVRDGDAYLFVRIEEGIGGLPVGAQQSSVAPMTGRAESAVATFLMLKRGSPVFPLYLDCDGLKSSKDEVLGMVEKLRSFHPDLTLRVAPFQQVSEKISERVPEDLRRIVCERIKLRVAERISEEIEAKALVSDTTLEGLASSKLSNIGLMEKRVDLPVIYPLSGLDESDIREAEEKIGLETSGSGDLPCPQPFPRRDLSIKEVRKAEKELSEESMMEPVMESIEVFEPEV